MPVTVVDCGNLSITLSTAKIGITFRSINPDPTVTFNLFNVVILSIAVLNKIPSKVETANKIAKHFLRRPGGIYGRPSSSNVDVYHVAYIIDDSGSIGNYSFQRGLRALRLMIDRADRTDYAAVKFSTNANLLFHFVSGCQARLNLMSVPYTAGATNTQAALRLVRTQLFQNPNSGVNRRGGRTALVMTDGKSNINKSQTIPQANLLKAAGVEVFVLAVGSYDPAGIQEMRDICSVPYQDHLFRVDDFRSLVDVVNLIPPNSNPLQCKYLPADRSL